MYTPTAIQSFAAGEERLRRTSWSCASRRSIDVMSSYVVQCILMDAEEPLGEGARGVCLEFLLACSPCHREPPAGLSKLSFCAVVDFERGFLSSFEVVLGHEEIS